MGKQDKETNKPELQPLQLGNQEEAQPSKIGYGLFIVFFALFFLLFMAVSEIFVTRHRQIEEHKQEIQAYEKEIEDLEQENVRLYRKLEFLKTLEGQEKIARKKLKLVYPDEKIVEWEEVDEPLTEPSKEGSEQL
jgi:cell division protein FtsB